MEKDTKYFIGALVILLIAIFFFGVKNEADNDVIKDITGNVVFPAGCSGFISTTHGRFSLSSCPLLYDGKIGTGYIYNDAFAVQDPNCVAAYGCPYLAAKFVYTFPSSKLIKRVSIFPYSYVYNLGLRLSDGTFQPLLGRGQYLQAYKWFTYTFNPAKYSNFISIEWDVGSGHHDTGLFEFMVNPDGVCFDGTPYRQCSTNTKRCDYTGALVNCGTGQTCVDGMCTPPILQNQGFETWTSNTVLSNWNMDRRTSANPSFPPAILSKETSSTLKSNALKIDLVTDTTLTWTGPGPTVNQKVNVDANADYTFIVYAKEDGSSNSMGKAVAALIFPDWGGRYATCIRGVADTTGWFEIKCTGNSGTSTTARIMASIAGNGKYKVWFDEADFYKRS